MRTCESVKRKRINVGEILHGPRMLQPMVRWKIFFMLSFMMFVSSSCGYSLARNPLIIQKIAKTFKSDKDELSSKHTDDGWREGNLLDGPDRELWGSVSVQQQKKNIYTQELPFVNFTHNDTEDYQLAIHDKETWFHKRMKRGVKGLYDMISCATGCDPFSYKGHGNYCGFRGSGVVMDDIDTCCQIHDKCYDSSTCFTGTPYILPYSWHCDNNEPVCEYSHGLWGEHHSCAGQLCHCDRMIANCLKNYPCL